MKNGWNIMPQYVCSGIITYIQVLYILKVGSQPTDWQKFHLAIIPIKPILIWALRVNILIRRS